jgi:hypothetical protein
MSYYATQETIDKSLRLGDIIAGFSHVMPTFEDFINNGNDFSLDVKNQNFFSVITPCCSIEDNVVTLAPLKHLLPIFFLNPYLVEDFTRINRLVSPKNSIPPKAWENLKPEEAQTKLSIGDSYIFGQFFVYEPDGRLPNYELIHKTFAKTLNIYMIDFKEAFTITSKKIQRGATYPKVLQLSIKTRGEMRTKMAAFYARIPDEDKVL